MQKFLSGFVAASAMLLTMPGPANAALYDPVCVVSLVASQPLQSDSCQHSASTYQANVRLVNLRPSLYPPAEVDLKVECGTQAIRVVKVAERIRFPFYADQVNSSSYQHDGGICWISVKVIQGNLNSVIIAGAPA